MNARAPRDDKRLGFWFVLSYPAAGNRLPDPEQRTMEDLAEIDDGSDAEIESDLGPEKTPD